MGLGRAGESAELFGVLARLVHRTSQDAAVILRRERLNPAQFQLLLAVRDQPGATQTELGERFGVTGANVSLLVSKLTAAGWLERRASGAANHIRLTDEGEGLVERLAPQQDLFMFERFGTLSEREFAEFHRLAKKTLAGLPPAG